MIFSGGERRGVPVIFPGPRVRRGVTDWTARPLASLTLESSPRRSQDDGPRVTVTEEDSFRGVQSRGARARCFRVSCKVDSVKTVRNNVRLTA